ncbi:MAG: nitroreductase/quinone reductase family protein [Pseudomonadales bacterium]
MLRLVIILGSLLLVGCEPMGPLPGGELDGQLQEATVSWMSFAEVELVQLETRPSDPYSINMWGVTNGEKYYIASGGGRKSEWVGHILEDPKVRRRIEENIFELKAVLVSEEDELTMVEGLYDQKYDMESVGQDSTDDILVYRLDPR